MLNKKYEIIRELEYGWSDDRKYLVQDESGKKYLLRRSPETKKHHAQQEFSLVQQLHGMGLNMPAPIEMSALEENAGVERIYAWIEGDMLQDVLSALEPSQQYALGVQAGSMLEAIHSLKYEEEAIDWASQYRLRVLRKIESYKQCGVRLEQEDSLTHWINEYEHVLDSRAVVYQHGDYHPGNMILTLELDLYIIDFDRHSIGDPWEEFNRIVWSAKISPLFASGQINGYFMGKIPDNFFRMLKYYLAINALGSIPWAIKFGESEINVMKDQARLISSWYLDQDQTIPNWYVHAQF